MKILFVCQANAARSQIAKALFNERSTHRADGAGTTVHREGGTLAEAADHPQVGIYVRNILAAMAEVGLDLGPERRLQLTEGMVEEADRVVVMAPRDTWPEFLTEGGKTTIWDVPDPAEATSLEHVRALRDHIRGLVEDLVAEID